MLEYLRTPPNRLRWPVGGPRHGWPEGGGGWEMDINAPPANPPPIPQPLQPPPPCSLPLPGLCPPPLTPSAGAGVGPLLFVKLHPSPLHRTHNLATQTAGGIPFASSSLPGRCAEPGPRTGTAPGVAGPRCWHNVNDGVRADERGWAPGAPHGGERFVGVRLADAAPVQYVAWGRDATGRFPKGGWEGVAFALQYTAEALTPPLPPGGGSGVAWQDAVQWQDYAGAFALASAATHVFELRPPVTMTAMRLVVSSALATVDELGLYLQRDAAAAYDSAADACAPDPRAARTAAGLSIGATVRLTALDPTAGPGLSAYVRGTSFADAGDFAVGFGAYGRLGLAVKGNEPEAVWFDYAFQVGVEYAIDLHYAVAGASARLRVDGEAIQTLRYDSTAGVVGIANGTIGCAANGTGRLRGVISGLTVGTGGAGADAACDGRETVLEIVTRDYAAEVGWALVGVKPPYRMVSRKYGDNTVNRVEFCLPSGDYDFYATDAVWRPEGGRGGGGGGGGGALEPGRGGWGQP